MNENTDNEATTPASPADSPITPAEAQPAPAPPSEASSTGLAPNVAAGLCAVFPLIAGIVFMILEKKDSFVKFWAYQSLYFGVCALVASTVVMGINTVLLFIPILGWLLGLLLTLALTLSLMALWIYGIIQAFQQRIWKMPILGDIVEKQLASQSGK